jgi:hypothetical protein
MSGSWIASQAAQWPTWVGSGLAGYGRLERQSEHSVPHGEVVVLDLNQTWAFTPQRDLDPN